MFIIALLNILSFILKIAAFAALMDVTYNFLIEQDWTYDDFENFSTTICWSILRIYGKIQIFSNNYIISPFKFYVLPPLTNAIKLVTYEKPHIVFVKDGNETATYLNKSMISYKNVNEYDFILFYPKNKRTMILNNINDIPDKNEVDPSSLNTTVSFMCCQITISLKNEKTIKKFIEINEFCVNSNKILDEAFVNWYCKKHFNNEFDIKDIKTYDLNLLDADVNNIVLGPNKFISITADSYRIDSNDLDVVIEDSVAEDVSDNDGVQVDNSISELNTSNDNEKLCENNCKDEKTESPSEPIEKDFENEIEKKELNNEPSADKPINYWEIGWMFPII